MKGRNHRFILLLSASLLVLMANTTIGILRHPGFLAVWIPCVVGITALPLLAQTTPPSKQLWFLTHGNYCLKVFFLSSAVSIPCQLFWGIYLLPDELWGWLLNLLLCFGALTPSFLVGIIAVYCTSYQLGVKIRILGLILGWIPLVNIWILVMIIIQTNREMQIEQEKELLNIQRQEQQICKTKYPILLVHGVFFRDYKYFGYWGRIPQQLQRNGAQVYFGNQPSAASIAQCAQILTQRMKQITEETGCPKVNIIAHSKGGLDCRYAMAFYDAHRYVASLTTINTPHKGSSFADFLLNNVPHKAQKQICGAYNKALNKLGEPEADLMVAAQDLTTRYCTILDRDMPQPAGVVCRSVGSKMNRPIRGRFPMNFTGVMMQTIERDHDGLVSADSFPWGDRFTFLTSDSPIGISHMDMTDLNRTNLPGFDVREFYVQMVAELKNQGL